MIAFSTVSGRRVDLSAPTPADITIEDIACGLSHVCRYGGQIRAFYSVAQHACLVASLVPDQIQYPALCHDNTEAYLGDVSRSLKYSEFMDGYRTLEHQWSQFLAQMHGIEHQRDSTKDRIKAADDLATVFEHITFRTAEMWNPWKHIKWAMETGFISKATLTPDGSKVATMMDLSKRLPGGLMGLSPWEAERRYLEMYERVWRPNLHGTHKLAGGHLW